MTGLRGMASGVVVHPWMDAAKAADVDWLAWALGDARDRLEAGIGAAQAALHPQSEHGLAHAPAPGPGVRGRDASVSLARLFAALDEVVAAVAAHGVALAEHGPAIEALGVRLASLLPFSEQAREVGAQIRVHTDALSEADVRLRRAVEAATGAVPTGADPLEVVGFARRVGPMPSAARGHGTAGRPRSRADLAGLDTRGMERRILADPRLRTHLATAARPLGLSGDTPSAEEWVGLARRAGVEAERCERAERAVRPGEHAVDQVRDVFAALGLEAALRLSALWPALVGPAGGVPLEARARANRELLRAALADARSSDVALEAQGIAQRVADAGRLLPRLRSAAMEAYAGWESVRTMVALPVSAPLARRVELRARIRLYLRLLTGESVVSLLEFSSAGRGRVVELIGRPGPHTDRVAVLVPGTGTGMYGYHMPRGTCRDLVAADETGRTVAVCWVGADFPMGLVNESSSAHFAERGGPALVRCAVGLRASLAPSIAPGARWTVIGHSYGSALVGAAEKAGLPAEQVAYLAAAGAGPGVTAVSDYAVRDARGRPRSVHRFACTAPGDPIRWLFALESPGLLTVLWHVAARLAGRRAPWTNPLGVDPQRLPGVEVFEAGVWEEPRGEHRPGEPVAGPSGHAGIITPGTTAFRRLSAIVSGDTQPPAP